MQKQSKLHKLVHNQVATSVKKILIVDIVVMPITELVSSVINYSNQIAEILFLDQLKR